MCRDCPTARDRLKAAAREIIASLLLPVILYAIPVGTLLALGYMSL